MKKPIRILVAGCANPHVPLYLRNGARNISSMHTIAVSDFDPGRLEKAKMDIAASGRDDVEFYSDYQEMFRRHQDADAVMIGSDNIEHFQMFKDAVKAGFHIYMMKVISMDEAECREMIAIGKNYPKVIQCELELHFHPGFYYAKKMIESGRLGELKGIYLTNVSQSPCNYFPNWGDPLLSYGKRIPIMPGSHTFRGGAITDHPHPFDMIRYLTGHEFRTVRAVSAENQRSHLLVEDHAAITGTLDNGVPYFINPSYSNMEEKVPTRRLLWPKSLECNLKLIGTKGCFMNDYFIEPTFIVGNGYVSPDRLIVDGSPQFQSEQDHSLIGSFVDCIQGRRHRPETTLEDDFAAIRVMNAAYDSIYSGKEVVLDDLN